MSNDSKQYLYIEILITMRFDADMNDIDILCLSELWMTSNEITSINIEGYLEYYFSAKTS